MGLTAHFSLSSEKLILNYPERITEWDAIHQESGGGGGGVVVEGGVMTTNIPLRNRFVGSHSVTYVTGII